MNEDDIIAPPSDDVVVADANVTEEVEQQLVTDNADASVAEPVVDEPIDEPKDEVVADEEVVTPPVEEPKPEPKDTIADPGEFAPQDYSFTITLADGTTIDIKTPEDMDNLPADADFGTPANLMKAQAAFNKMVVGIEQDKRDYEADKKKFEDHTEIVQQQEKQISSWEKELGYLEAKGSLPKVADDLKAKDWNDPEVQKAEGVKERVAIVQFMEAENKVRDQAGLPRVTSMLEAYALMQSEAGATAKAEQVSKEAKERKARGAMVGGGTSATQSNIPDDMIIGEGGSIRDLDPAY